MRAVLERRALETLTQGHLANHVNFLCRPHRVCRRRGGLRGHLLIEQ
jgi:hypothetical protein